MPVKVLCPLNVTNINLTTSGNLVPNANGIINPTAAEATRLVQDYSQPRKRSGSSDTATNMFVYWAVGDIVIDVDLSGVKHAMNNLTDLATAVPPADFVPLVTQGFQLVNGL